MLFLYIRSGNAGVVAMFHLLEVVLMLLRYAGYYIDTCHAVIVHCVTGETI